MKVLKVLHSQDLPALLDRDPNVIYYIYNTLEITIGQNWYTDPYLITDHDPTDPITGMMYIILDSGNVKMLEDYSLKIIAQVESPEMMDLLKTQGGSYFFVNADKRYLDAQRRIITLPYRNGQWDLTVDAANNIQLTEDSAIGFNPETNCFDISATKYDYNLVFTDDYKGVETPTASVTVDQHTVKADVKISSEYGNIIKVVNDGLTAIVTGKVTASEFDSWRTAFYDYKATMDGYMSELEEKVGHLEIDISEAAISAKIHAALVEVYPLIDESLVKYQKLMDDFDRIRIESKAYTDDQFREALQEIKDIVNNADYWGDMPNT